MPDNGLDVRLLREDPERLLVRYQPVVRIIVRNLAHQRFIPRADVPDLIQEVNRKLVERFPRICARYNQRSLFRTYFSVVVRNLCLEELRKARPVPVAREEPAEQAAGGTAIDSLLIAQEYERLCRAVRLFGNESPALLLALRFMAGLPAEEGHLSGFHGDPGPERRSMLADRLNAAVDLQKKEKFAILADVMAELDRKPRSADALRKWFSDRQDELVRLMNGNPPRSAYTAEILYILVERAEILQYSG